YSAAGGLVGRNEEASTITDSQAFGNVASTASATWSDQSFAGGLVGHNAGTITSTNAPTAASSTCTAGGGFSCATGNVSVGVGGNGGGPVGVNSGTIENAFAIGNLAVASGSLGDGVTVLGGLAGANFGTITNSHAWAGTIGSATANALTAGGLVGLNI